VAAPRGYVTINRNECKGCGLCIEACPPECLDFEPGLSAYGVHPAKYLGLGCTGCGICFYACPEPGAITVYRLREGKPAPATTEEAMLAPAL
jgi:NAD-dependent dihydropyrimidine dehydrogenase PreA subunit